MNTDIEDGDEVAKELFAPREEMDGRRHRYRNNIFPAGHDDAERKYGRQRSAMNSAWETRRLVGMVIPLRWDHTMITQAAHVALLRVASFHFF